MTLLLGALLLLSYLLCIGIGAILVYFNILSGYYFLSITSLTIGLPSVLLIVRWISWKHTKKKMLEAAFRQGRMTGTVDTGEIAVSLSVEQDIVLKYLAQCKKQGRFPKEINLDI